MCKISPIDKAYRILGLAIPFSLHLCDFDTVLETNYPLIEYLLVENFGFHSLFLHANTLLIKAA